MCDQQSRRSAWAYKQSDQSFCLSLEYSLTVKLLTEHHLEFLHLKGGCTGSSEPTHVKMPQCWKSHVMAHFCCRSLAKLNVSYNQIEDLSGIKALVGASYSLTHLDLHGNKLASVAHVSQCLCRVNNLKNLTLSLDGSGNPLCHKSGLYI